MISLPPVVRYFVLCQDFLIDPGRPADASIVKLIHSIYSKEKPPFPYLMDEICAFAGLSNCRGTGKFEVCVVEADSGETVHQMAAMPVDFGLDPLRFFGLPIRIRRCVFPNAGLYWVQLRYNGREIAEQDLLLR